MVFCKYYTPIQIAKTLLHEAFHTNLMQRAYAIFGSAEINNLWAKKPEDMALQELMNIFESKLAGTSIITIHHQYIAQNIAVLVSGLKEFAQKYDVNYGNANDYQFYGLAWEGLDDTKYYKDNVKDKQIYYIPGTDMHINADTLYRNQRISLLSSSNVNCTIH